VRHQNAGVGRGAATVAATLDLFLGVATSGSSTVSSVSFQGDNTGNPLEDEGDDPQEFADLVVTCIEDNGMVSQTGSGPGAFVFECQTATARIYGEGRPTLRG
jgi:hypothetical protein